MNLNSRIYSCQRNEYRFFQKGQIRWEIQLVSPTLSSCLLSPYQRCCCATVALVWQGLPSERQAWIANFEIKIWNEPVFIMYFQSSSYHIQFSIQNLQFYRDAPLCLLIIIHWEHVPGVLGFSLCPKQLEDNTDLLWKLYSFCFPSCISCLSSFVLLLPHPSEFC